MGPARASKLASVTGGALLLPLIMALGSMPSSLAAGAADRQDFPARLEEAEQLRGSAAARGFEWLRTAELLEEARLRHEAGDMQQAWQLLEQGHMQAEHALRQAEHEAEAWQRRVVR